jgi:branched-chain amino acid transport system ATP-binding protein
VLVLEDVHAHYGSAHVLQGVGLEVQAGQIACLVGRNGAGKSTTLKAIMGIVPLSGGSISFRGERIDGRAPYRVAAMGLAWVPEERRIFGSLTVEENIRVAAQAVRRPDSGRRVREALEFFPDLLARRRSLGKNLSGGQQQMLAIARALACQPELLMLDEPTEGLAPSMVSAIRAGILESRARGVSILLVEQNLRMALSVGDVFFVVSRGTVVFRGTRAELQETADIIGEHLGVGRVGRFSEWREDLQSPSDAGES